MISNPIKKYINKKYPNGQISQGFGENPALYMAAIGMKSHNGIDIVAPHGTPLYAVESGKVVEVKTDTSGYGMHIRFLTDSKEWTYGHLSKILVKGGEEIKVGQKIAEMGNTGFVVSSINGAGFWVDGSNKYAGTHLHLSCRDYSKRTSSWKYSTGEKGIVVKNYDNGWNGCYDFANQFNPDPMMGDMEIFKRELEGYGDEPWFIKFIRALKFFNN